MKSVGSFRRNVLSTLKQMMIAIGYEVIEHRSENYVEIINGDVVNYFYIFGGKDESSQDLIQGLTICALLLDEVALMPESFFNQASARLSVEGAKMFVNCNPAGIYHWFYKNILQQAKEKDVLYIHFTMDDNLSLTEDIKNRYKRMYTGVFAKRYIDGKWCAAEGLIYDMFNEEEMVVEPEEIPYDEMEKWVIGCDYGTANATVFLMAGKTFDGKIYIAREYYFAGREEAQAQGDFEAQKTDIEYAGDLKQFIMEAYPLTGKTYRSTVNDSVNVIVDPAAASFILQLRRQRFKVSKANNSVLDGIRTVASAFSEGNLKVSSECVNLIDELHTYSWDKKAQERGVDKPVKSHDHCCDALRYLCMKLKAKTKMDNVTKKVGW